jgi:hypothetical protein
VKRTPSADYDRPAVWWTGSFSKRISFSSAYWVSRVYWPVSLWPYMAVASPLGQWHLQAGSSNRLFAVGCRADDGVFHKGFGICPTVQGISLGYQVQQTGDKRSDAPANWRECRVFHGVICMIWVA